MRSIVESGLREAGFEVTAVAGAAAALELVEAESQRFDIVLTDYVMPKMNGLELAEAIRRVDPQIGVILHSAWSTAPDPRVDLVVEKPATIEVLVKAVELVLERAGGASERRASLTTWPPRSS
ncbi:MAG: response regulator [Polyangiaceae bacterium]|nr:response regulator [Polyangiaceae bacterium]